MSRFSSFLFARPSSIEGVARIFDFGNTLTEYNYSENGEQADQIALVCDWAAIGKDLEHAMRRYSQSLIEGKTDDQRTKEAK